MPNKPKKDEWQTYATPYGPLYVRETLNHAGQSTQEFRGPVRAVGEVRIRTAVQKVLAGGGTHVA